MAAAAIQRNLSWQAALVRQGLKPNAATDKAVWNPPAAEEYGKQSLMTRLQAHVLSEILNSFCC